MRRSHDRPDEVSRWMKSDTLAAKAVTRRRAGPLAIPETRPPPQSSPKKILLSCRIFLLGTYGTAKLHIPHGNPAISIAAWPVALKATRTGGADPLVADVILARKFRSCYCHGSTSASCAAKRLCCPPSGPTMKIWTVDWLSRAWSTPTANMMAHGVLRHDSTFWSGG